MNFLKNFIENINFNPDKAIVGERVKRTEKLIFKVCYKVHKAITYISTGQSIKFGNYTCLPKSTIDKMINEKATWSSFSGALQKVEKDKVEVPSERGVRYFGPSKMSFLNLIKHSLSINTTSFLIKLDFFWEMLGIKKDVKKYQKVLI